jgi:hypothetical protein
MHKIFQAASALMIVTAAAPAFAQEDYSAPPATSVAETPHTNVGGHMANERASFTPEVGVFSYGTPNNGTQARGVVGFGLDMNAITTFIAPENRNDTVSRLYVGPQTGFFFTHVGDETSNFWGTNSTNTASVTAGANIMYIPLDLKVGFLVEDNFRLSVHGGGNLLYQSVAGSVAFANATTVTGAAGGSSSWNIYPNVGADVEFAVEKNVSILLRPDWTFTSGTSPFSGTIGVGIGIG